MPILSSQEIFRLADQLPRITPSALEIISYIDNPDTSRDKIVGLVKADQQIFIECLKQANSAAISSSRTYRTINEIVDIMGSNHIKKVALFLSAKSMVKDKSIWFESVFTAIAAQYLALKAGLSNPEADRVYMAGLFMNFGAFILKTSYPAIYSKILKAEDFRDRIKMEKEEFGISYPEISALLLSSYGLPAYVTEIMNVQSGVYNGSAEKENGFIEIARILSTIQNLNIDKIYSTLDTRAIKDVLDKSAIEILSLSQESVDRFERQTKELINN